MKNSKPVEFSLDGRDYIELNNLLKLTGLCNSGGEAKAFISNGEVSVDSQMELRKRCKIRAGQQVMFNDTCILVKP